MEHGVNVVTPDWILDCDVHGTRLSECLYHPSLLEFDEQTTTASSETLNGPSSFGDHNKLNATDNEMAEPVQSKIEEQGKNFPSTSNKETAVGSNSLEQKPQSCNEALGSSILQGIIFHIIDYPQCVGNETIEKWKKVGRVCMMK